MSLFSWNIENLPRYLAPAAGTPTLAQIVEAWGAPEIVCLQETRIRPRDVELVRRHLREAALRRRRSSGA